MQQQYPSALQKSILLLTQVPLEKVDDATLRPEQTLFFFFFYKQWQQKDSCLQMSFSIAEVVNTLAKSRSSLINFSVKMFF